MPQISTVGAPGGSIVPLVVASPTRAAGAASAAMPESVNSATATAILRIARLN
jgi:hypothetical protein